MLVLSKSNQSEFKGFPNDPAACCLVTGDPEALFLLGHGMLGVSLCQQGTELRRRMQDFEGIAAKSGLAAIPFLHPWANRFEGPRAGLAPDAAPRAVGLLAHLHLFQLRPVHLSDSGVGLTVQGVDQDFQCSAAQHPRTSRPVDLGRSFGSSGQPDTPAVVKLHNLDTYYLIGDMKKRLYELAEYAIEVLCGLSLA
ncbi:MAG TPA: hypothetical protein DCP92_23280 [Nitrospiraceae bacterium]|nr:hypothetical protein [Nitrospiraceae bacterium]